MQYSEWGTLCSTHKAIEKALFKSVTEIPGDSANKKAVLALTMVSFYSPDNKLLYRVSKPSVTSGRLIAAYRVVFVLAHLE